MIYYCSPSSPQNISGGTRKLYDHVAILSAHGFDARIAHGPQDAVWSANDLAVIPEVWGDALSHMIPPGVRRVSFVQNPWLVNHACHDPANDHPYRRTPELVAILTESDLSTGKAREQFPDLECPVIRTHSSGNGRDGQDAGFHYGEWPRAKRIVYLGYKQEDVNSAIFDGLSLPEGWECVCMAGMSDEQIADLMRTSAIFAAANRFQGMCAPTSEAMISGCAIVCWTGEGPDEYLVGRAEIARQDDIEDLRGAIVDTAQSIDSDPDWWGAQTRERSDWFQARYSRDAEIHEICSIMWKLHG